LSIPVVLTEMSRMQVEIVKRIAELPDRYDSLLYRHPRLSVLSIGGEGSAALHELRPHRSPLGNISPAELVATIRAAARASAGRPV
jgi:hypothetical protein